MRYIFGIWTVIVALTVSVVAAFYSIIGLTAIFAAAVIPVIIMGVVLEVAKVTTAVWLHSFWHEAPVLMKFYLTTATIILMFITSMGIFGFLSKAHIEQGAGVAQLSAQIGRIDEQVSREQQAIERATNNINAFDSRVDSTDTDIQSRIEIQERLINDIRNRLDRDIAVQNEIISQAIGANPLVEQRLTEIDQQISEFEQLLQSDDVVAIQNLVGVTADGVRGPATNAAIAQYQNTLNEQRNSILNSIQQQSNRENPAADAARERISELQTAANAEIARAQDAIDAFRQQLINVTTADNSKQIAAQETVISEANMTIDQLVEQRFELEEQLRIIEVEVGPVRYIAELIYGETNKQILEEAVRWVIIILVFVFDPLAVILILAGVTIMHSKKNEDVDIDEKEAYIEPSEHKKEQKNVFNKTVSENTKTPLRPAKVIKSKSKIKSSPEFSKTPMSDYQVAEPESSKTKTITEPTVEKIPLMDDDEYSSQENKHLNAPLKLSKVVHSKDKK